MKRKPMTAKERAIKRRLRRLAHALAWDMSISKAMTPRQMYLAQTEGGQERFDISARDFYRCLVAAGLVLRVRGER